MWVIPTVSREVHAWRERACTIPATPIREDALNALTTKRFNLEGAALFAVLPPRRDMSLVRLLVAFQALLDFLDNLTERSVPEPLASGEQLHRALVEALEPSVPMSDYYRYHPWREDDGYLTALVSTCRECCARLPAYRAVQASVVQAARRCAVQGLNHDPNPTRRESRLRQWAAAEFAGENGLSWWELTAAASSTLGIHALLAHASDPSGARREARAVDAAYMPWVCAASTMLDSYVDELSDTAGEGHSYVAHYASPSVATRRVRDLVHRSIAEVCVLRGGARHALIVAGMTAMYLSADEARTPAMRARTARFIAAGGSLTRALLPILRLWRILAARRDA